MLPSDDKISATGDELTNSTKPKLRDFFLGNICHNDTSAKPISEGHITRGKAYKINLTFAIFMAVDGIFLFSLFFVNLL